MSEKILTNSGKKFIQLKKSIFYQKKADNFNNLSDSTSISNKSQQKSPFLVDSSSVENEKDLQPTYLKQSYKNQQIICVQDQDTNLLRYDSSPDSALYKRDEQEKRILHYFTFELGLKRCNPREKELQYFEKKKIELVSLKKQSKDLSHISHEESANNNNDNGANNSCYSQGEISLDSALYRKRMNKKNNVGKLNLKNLKIDCQQSQ